MKKWLLLAASLAAINLFNPSAYAWSLFPDRVCSGKAANSPTCQQARNQSKTDNPVAKILGDAANIIALLAGAVAVIIIIISGFQFVTSAGNSDAVSKARSRLLGAIIGLVIIALAWLIIRITTDFIIQ